MSAALQYDAVANPSAAQRDVFPYLVVLQSDQLSGFSTRLVMPLARGPAPAPGLPRRLAQSVQLQGERLYLAAHLCAALPARVLGPPVGSLRDAAGTIVDALDAVVSGV